MLNNALFITNEKYVDSSSKEGGVKFCTTEYISLISLRFDIEMFMIKVRSSFAYRFKKKYGLTVYNDYDVNAYRKSLQSVISEKNIEYIFLNLTNTIGFAKLLRELFPLKKIILCSHGNESGDFLHEIVMHTKQQGIKKFVCWKYRY